jgi:CheY-like chemotaxis protein
MQWVKLRPLVERCIQVMGAQAEVKGLALVHRVGGVEILTDALLFERVLRNLLDNAIKYTAAGGVTVETFQTPRGLELVVADTGRGIPANLREQIFKEYYQGPDARQMPGLGLGLAIVTRLCGLLGFGGPEVTDNEPQGSRFVLVVPPGRWRNGKTGEDSAVRPRSSDALDLAGLNVLCIDDDAISLDALCRLLRDWGCHAHMASSAGQAVALAKAQAQAQASASGGGVDVILCDQDLGRGDSGIELIARLRGVLGELPAVLITADAAILAAERSGDAGIELPILAKPVRYEDLKAMLHVFKELKN